MFQRFKVSLKFTHFLNNLDYQHKSLTFYTANCAFVFDTWSHPFSGQGYVIGSPFSSLMFVWKHFTWKFNWLKFIKAEGHKVHTWVLQNIKVRLQIDHFNFYLVFYLLSSPMWIVFMWVCSTHLRQKLLSHMVQEKFFSLLCWAMWTFKKSSIKLNKTSQFQAFLRNSSISYLIFFPLMQAFKFSRQIRYLSHLRIILT